MCALGLEDRLVGISHSCDYPPSVTQLPRLTSPRRNLDGLASAEIDAAVRAALREDGSVYAIDIDAINALEPELQQLSDIDLAAKTIGFREKLAQGSPLDDLLVESFAVVREAGRRVGRQSDAV